MTTKYLQLPPESEPPDISALNPFRSIVIVEEEVSSRWQSMISEWLVRSGCLYMMAWGKDCGSWDDSVDDANLALFDFAEIPEDKFVMTTWHELEPLEEVFWFAKNSAMHPLVDLPNTVIVHIATNNEEKKLLATYAED